MKRTYLIFAVLIVLLASGLLAYNYSLSQRQADIHERGAMVMPFNLSQTTHVFQKTQTGGVQKVTYDSEAQENLQGIRTHLHTISQEFSAGNFSDPQTLHGEQMPGVSTLSAHASQLNITYSEIPRGAQIVYSADNQTLVDAIHRWFDAQLQDHGADATSTPESDPCENVPEGHDAQLWKMHHGC